MSETLIPKHGGYKNTKTWQLADLIYDITVRFCDKFVDRRSRTHDQMVQATRSGCQNLQEGSIDSATSKKIEIKLTGIAKGSLAELQRDYQKFLQHRDLGSICGMMLTLTPMFANSERVGVLCTIDR